MKRVDELSFPYGEISILAAGSFLERGADAPRDRLDAAQRYGRSIAGADKFGPSQGADTSRRLVRDPVCGTHVAEEVSIPLREGSELVHFCSTACRDAYTGSVRQFAANG